MQNKEDEVDLRKTIDCGNVPDRLEHCPNTATDLFELNKAGINSQTCQCRGGHPFGQMTEGGGDVESWKTQPLLRQSTSVAKWLKHPPEDWQARDLNPATVKPNTLKLTSSDFEICDLLYLVVDIVIKKKSSVQQNWQR